MLGGLFSTHHARMMRRRQAQKGTFLDVAQAALEDANREDDRKSMLQEIIEFILAKTGVSALYNVISQQVRSQEVIEGLAEKHEERQQRDSSPEQVVSPDIVKEPDSSEVQVHETGAITEPAALFSEYLWRMFRALLLASLVGLVYHFVYLSSHVILPHTHQLDRLNTKPIPTSTHASDSDHWLSWLDLGANH